MSFVETVLGSIFSAADVFNWENVKSVCGKTRFYVTQTNAPGLPDFSRHKIPKRGKIYQITTTLPNGHKI
jgi:hypothetical protein